MTLLTLTFLLSSQANVPLPLHSLSTPHHTQSLSHTHTDTQRHSSHSHTHRHTETLFTLTHTDTRFCAAGACGCSQLNTCRKLKDKKDTSECRKTFAKERRKKRDNL